MPASRTSALPSPKRWTLAQLQAARDTAEALYIANQGPAGSRDAFALVYAQVEAQVETALQKSGNLLLLNAATLAQDRALWKILRFFCGPPISEENLWTFVGRKFTGNLPTGLEGRMAGVLMSAVDRVRFPWVDAAVEPTAEQRRIALVSTSMLLAQAQFNTSNRSLAAQTQEGAVCASLTSAGYALDASASTALALEPGTFCREKTIYNKKCDVPIRLLDGRLLTLECKVSNTPKNSWKRLNQETVGKSTTWREHMTDQVVTGCVLAGVFDTACLVQAQDQGVWIFWQHDLAELESFVVG